MASSSDDEINTMKVGDTFHNHLEEKKKGKKDKENATAKTNAKTVKEKEKDSNAKSAKDWTDKEVSLLIDMLEANPCLWDVYHTDYSKRDVREIAYSEIATSLETNIPSIKTKINGLRAQLKRQKKKTPNMGKAMMSFTQATGFITTS